MEVWLDNLLNALDANVALIDQRGEILAVNDAWRCFASENGGKLTHLGVGVNYLDVCKNAEDEDGNAFYEGLLSVLSGTQDRFQYRYPCHSPTVRRYYLGAARKVDLQGESGVLVTHHDVTNVLVEERAQGDRAMLAMAIFHSCPLAILSFEIWGGLIDANPSACRLFGYPEGGMSACTFDLLFPDSGHSLRQLSETLRDDAVTSAVNPFVTTICTVEIEAMPVEANVGLAELGERQIMVFTLRDLRPVRSERGMIPYGPGQTFRSNDGLSRLADTPTPLHSMRIEQVDSLVGNFRKLHAGEGTRGYHILVVDDDESTLDLTRKILAEQGHSTVLACDGVQALEVFRRQIDEINLVITDYQMPWMNGCEFIRVLRKMVRELPIIVLTGANDLIEGELDHDRSIRVVEKPCRASKLLTQLGDLMKTSSQQ